MNRPRAMNRPREISRRAVLAGGGALVLGFTLGGPLPGAGAAAGLPPHLATSPLIDSWIRIAADGRVTIFTGKVDLGQGLSTALAQIAADELYVAIGRLQVVTADTARTPNEGGTVGSMSIQQAGSAIRQAAAEARQALLEMAARKLNAPLDTLSVEDGTVSSQGGPATTYGALVGGRHIGRQATGTAVPRAPGTARYVGQPVARLDIPAKMFGRPAYLQDLRPRGMVHGRIVRPPHPGAALRSLDESATAALPGVIHIHRQGNFIGLIAGREEQAIGAARQLARDAQWSDPPPLPAGDPGDWLDSLPATETVVSGPGTRLNATHSHRARYYRPFQAHASLAPSAALALYRPDSEEQLTVWTHSQDIFGLRTALAGLLDMPARAIRLIHRESAGCYGHNGADDAAADAALLARAVPGRPVRLQWMREDEFLWEPAGPAMAIELAASLDAGGRISAFESTVKSFPHSSRPGGRPGNLLASQLVDGGFPPIRGANIPPPRGGVERNATPYYSFPHRVVEHFIATMPVRTSAHRGLGAYGNIFALESFIDELARAAGADPLAFRLRHLDDARARAVLEKAALEAGWGSSKPDRGRGIAFARYKNAGAFMAIVIDVDVNRKDGTLHVRRAVAAVDCGRIVNPIGVETQIEGGIIQSTSWTLHEALLADGNKRARDWSDYPILTFSEVPDITVHMIDRPAEKPLGAGEAAQGPTAAAIANALFDATGLRLRGLPLQQTLTERG